MASGTGTRMEERHQGADTLGKTAERRLDGACGDLQADSKVSNSRSESSFRSTGSIGISDGTVCGQGPAQTLAGAVQALLDGPDIGVHDLGDFFERDALIFEENQRFLLQRGKVRDGGGDRGCHIQR